MCSASRVSIWLRSSRVSRSSLSSRAPAPGEMLRTARLARRLLTATRLDSNWATVGSGFPRRRRVRLAASSSAIARERITSS